VAKVRLHGGAVVLVGDRRRLRPSELSVAAGLPDLSRNRMRPRHRLVGRRQVELLHLAGARLDELETSPRVMERGLGAAEDRVHA
jgi:hypothetical protein